MLDKNKLKVLIGASVFAISSLVFTKDIKQTCDIFHIKRKTNPI